MTNKNEDNQVFNAEYVRKLQAEIIKKQEEEKRFIDPFGIEKQTFHEMMDYIRRTILNTVATRDTEVTVYVTEAYMDTPYWMNTNFRKKISQVIETNYSKIAMGFRSELESLGFEVKAKSANKDFPTSMDPPVIEVKEIELKISW